MKLVFMERVKGPFGGLKFSRKWFVPINLFNLYPSHDRNVESKIGVEGTGSIDSNAQSITNFKKNSALQHT